MNYGIFTKRCSSLRISLNLKCMDQAGYKQNRAYMVGAEHK